MSEEPAKYEVRRPYKPTILVDFDGVIHRYQNGWQGETVITEPPVDGAKEAIDTLRKECKVVIFSTRAQNSQGIEAIRQWLKQWGIEVDGITDRKLPATVIIDDRAVCFRGNWKETLDETRDFKTYRELD